MGFDLNTIKSAANDYIEAGFALCQPALGSKGPNYLNWQHNPRGLDQINEALGLGLLHVQSRTCAIDLDELHQASEWLEARGVDVAGLLQSDDGVQITSGRPNRAKLLYRLPPDVAPLATIQIHCASGEMMIEFRHASKEGGCVQDVLPPTIHPDTGKPYEWAGAGDFRALPELPAALLNVWINHGADTTPKAPTQAINGDIVDGGRNNTLFKKAGDMAGLKFPEAAINAALQEVNREQCKPPLAAHEVATIARSATKNSKGAKLANIDLSAFIQKIDPSTGEVLDTPFSLDQFALNGQSQIMRSKMLEDKHVLGTLAILGQSTVFFTERNGGKTLLTIWLLIEGIRTGQVCANDVYYINSDDTYKGLVEKTEFAERHGFKMLSDGHAGFKNDMLPRILEKLGTNGTASGKIVILDTLKKFTDTMDKKKSSGFMQSLRAFVLHGGTVIMLAHVNKHRDEAGKLVFSGTTDVVDDADCYYIMDKITRNGKTIVTFENGKARGDVAEKAVYQFERNPNGGQSYADLLATVQPLGDDDLKRFKKGEQVEAMLSANSKIIGAVLAALQAGVNMKTELVQKVMDETGQSKRKVIEALEKHTGTNWLDGHRWEVVKGEKNTLIYKEVGLKGKPWGGVKNMESMESMES